MEVPWLVHVPLLWESKVPPAVPLSPTASTGAPVMVHAPLRVTETPVEGIATQAPPIHCLVADVPLSPPVKRYGLAVEPYPARANTWSLSRLPGELHS